ncbi:MAG: hypothetical protein N2545_07120 [Thermoflexales bacterium]|nr:hypothetical protein [Thermoflexales bacterium]
MYVGIDFGLSNLDAVAMPTPAAPLHEWRTVTLRGRHMPNEATVRAALEALAVEWSEARIIAVTGGQHRMLPGVLRGTVLFKANELEAAGRGGLHLARSARPSLEEATVASCGSGTAVVAVRGRSVSHVSGSAVGGGTLLGLSRLLIGSTDPHEVDMLARQGNPNAIDLSLRDAVGGAIGRLPAEATAVNFGRVPLLERLELAHADLAAAIVTMVAQVVGVTAVSAARAESLFPIVFVGHLVDMISVRRVLEEVAQLYDAGMLIPELPGYATAVGALLLAAEGLPR